MTDETRDDQRDAFVKHELAPTAESVAQQLEDKLRADGLNVRVSITGLTDEELTEWSTDLDA